MVSTCSLQEVCELCSAELGPNGVQAAGLSFCCIGCHAVYQILETKQELDQGSNHPLFQQALRSGLIANPQLLEQMNRRGRESDLEWTRWHFEIDNLWCPACAEVIQLILGQNKGIRAILVDYATDVAVVEFAPMHLSKEMITSELAKLGYHISEFEAHEDKRINKGLLLRLCVGAFCAMNIMVLSYPVYASYFVPDLMGHSLTLAWLALLVSLPALGYCAFPIAQRFFTAMRIGYLGMEALVMLGVSAAFSLSLYNLLHGSAHVYFDSMTMIIVLVLAGKVIESKAKFTAKGSLLQLARSIPRRCRKKTDGGEAFVKASDVSPGECIIVMNGERIPLDGIVAAGEGSCDESLMTGESLPRVLNVGDSVLAGTMLVQGYVELSVSQAAEKTALARLVEVVTEDLNRKKAETPLIDRVVRWFVPTVGAIALATAFIQGPLAAIAVLLIACPCALGIATPLAEARLISALAALGAIVRNRDALRWLGREDVYFFDKTGTITEGKLSLIDGVGALTAGERGLLKAMVSRSYHPICRALHDRLNEPPANGVVVREEVGGGISGRYNEAVYKLGSARFTGVDADGTHFVKGDELITSFHFHDKLRTGVRELDLGVSTVILSGDRDGAVAAIAEEAGMQWLAEKSPLEKRAVIEKRRADGEVVAMVGDGINDAPALTAAHLGISVVTAADISIQVSDILLTTPDLTVLKEMRHLGRKGRRIVLQNIFWAFFYNGIGIGLAAVDLLSPIYATAAMITSSLVVVANAQRLLRRRV